MSKMEIKRSFHAYMQGTTVIDLQYLISECASYHIIEMVFFYA